jgi:hypothetical protein
MEKERKYILENDPEFLKYAILNTKITQAASKLPDDQPCQDDTAADLRK